MSTFTVAETCPFVVFNGPRPPKHDSAVTYEIVVRCSDCDFPIAMKVPQGLPVEFARTKLAPVLKRDFERIHRHGLMCQDVFEQELGQ